MAENQIVLFSLNKEVYGVNIEQVKHIISYSAPSEMPQMPGFIEGVVNNRGKAVPVVNLNKRFNMGETPVGKKTKIVVTDIDSKSVGFVVNDIIGLLKLNEGEMEAVPQVIRQMGNRYIEGFAKKDEKIISILDLKSILTDEEMEEFEKEAP